MHHFTCFFVGRNKGFILFLLQEKPVGHLHKKAKGDIGYLYCLQYRPNTKPKTRNEKDAVIFRQNICRHQTKWHRFAKI